MSLLWALPTVLLAVAVAITLLALRRVGRDVAALAEELAAVGGRRHEVVAALAHLRGAASHGRAGSRTGGSAQ